MEDADIIRLYFERSENAISESQKKYGALCRGLAMRITGNREDAEETENDTYLRAWDTIPPARPESLGAYLAAVCRRLAIDRLRHSKRKKRGGSAYDASLEELDGAVADCSADPADEAALRDTLTRFLTALSDQSRTVFMQRYFWCMTVKEIAADTGMRESAVKMTLARAREKLRIYLEETL